MSAAALTGLKSVMRGLAKCRCWSVAVLKIVVFRWDAMRDEDAGLSLSVFVTGTAELLIERVSSIGFVA